MKVDAQFRTPMEWERALLERLLQAEFPGRDELAQMIRDILVRTIDEDGGLELQSQVKGRALVIQRVPVEGEARDEDGLVIHVLLHVVEGKPVELEIYKNGAARIKRFPPPSEFELIALPPMPRNRRA